MPDAAGQQQWSGKTDGTPWMQRALIAMYRVLPLRVLYAVMALVVPFYMLFNHKGYRAAYHFYRQRLRRNPVSAFFSVYGNHFRFGQVVLDRFAIYAGKQFQFTVDGQELFDALADDSKGFLILSAHVGSFEMAGYCLNSQRKCLNALAFGGESETILAQRNKNYIGRNIRMIPVKKDMGHLFAINDALDKGEIVTMPADRLLGSNKKARCTFFGAEASFPLGAYSVARIKEVPILSVFVMKESAHRYHAFVHPVENPQQYAEQLEAIVRRYPLQWFNYYDFWQ